MHQHNTIRLQLFAALALVMASCAQIVGMEEGTLRQDEPASECEVFENCLKDATECRVPVACTNGRCEYNNTIRGKLHSAQTTGDCKNIVCDGDGATEFVVNDMDLPDDVNECTADSCSGGDAVYSPIPDKMLPCYEGPAGTENVGICSGGLRACDAQGNPSPTCVGQVLPAEETCELVLVDENCNGVVNESGPEGGTCSCGDGVLSPGVAEGCEDGNLNGGDGCSPICSPLQVAQLAVNGATTCVRINDGSVKCWGINDFGQLGIESKQTIGLLPTDMGANLASISFGAGKVATNIVRGWSFTCAWLNDDSIRCWGENTFGQLGQGDLAHRGDDIGEMGDGLSALDLGTGLPVVEIGLGVRHGCARFSDGSLKCWGGNASGQLGLEDVNNRGDIPGEMGINLPFVNVGSGLTVKRLALGSAHTCAILSNDGVKCWGSNSMGELGLGDTLPHGSGPTQMGDNLPFVNLGTGQTAKMISVGWGHTCAILDDDSVKCWGINNVGQLGLENTLNRGDDPSSMGDNLPPVNLGTGRTAKSISTSNGDTCALLDDDTLKCWGRNDAGQLGIGSTIAHGITPGDMGDALPPVDLGMNRRPISFGTGGGFACALLDDTSVKCWGAPANGRLGLGDMITRGHMPDTMGDNLPIVKLFSETW
jgi:cysteine-rich repeat protein